MRGKKGLAGGKRVEREEEKNLFGGIQNLDLSASRLFFRSWLSSGSVSTTTAAVSSVNESCPSIVFRYGAKLDRFVELLHLRTLLRLNVTDTQILASKNIARSSSMACKGYSSSQVLSPSSFLIECLF